VITCYNREEYIGEAIESASGQNYENKEVIVVDDGSTDGSWEIVKRAGPSVMATQTENCGVSHARNLGVQLASGDFVKFVDSDDRLRPRSLGAQLLHAIELPDRAISVTRASMIGEDGSPLERDDYSLLPSGFSGRIRPSVLLRKSTASVLPLFPRRALIECGGFNLGQDVGEDYDLVVRMLIRGFEFFQCDLDGYQVRSHRGARLSKGSTVAKYRQRLGSLERLYAAILGVPRELTFEDKVAFGQHIWAFGRAAVRDGFRDEAEKFFDLGRVVAGADAFVGSGMAGMLTSILGPVRAERVLEASKAIFLRNTSRKVRE
jgi:glycosyltransferase involved in cell wall biosynthesis